MCDFFSVDVLMLSADMNFACRNLFWQVFGDKGFGEAMISWEVHSFDGVD